MEGQTLSHYLLLDRLGGGGMGVVYKALDHPNICTVHEIDSTPDGQLFIVMSFVDGETLKARIERGRLAVEEAIDIATQV